MPYVHSRKTDSTWPARDLPHALLPPTHSSPFAEGVRERGEGQEVTTSQGGQATLEDA